MICVNACSQATEKQLLCEQSLKFGQHTLRLKVQLPDLPKSRSFHAVPTRSIRGAPQMQCSSGGSSTGGGRTQSRRDGC